MALLANLLDRLLPNWIAPKTDVDQVEVYVEAGYSYEFGVTGTGTFGLIDPTLALYDTNGNFVDFNDDTNGLDPEISFTATETGYVTLEIESFGNFYSGRYEVLVDEFVIIT